MSEFFAEVFNYVRNITAVEGGALLLGICYVWLAAKENVLCWPAGIIASLLALNLAINSNYQLDALKEGYYVLMGVYGWFAWTRTKGQTAGATRPIVSWSTRQLMMLIGVGSILTIIAGYIFSTRGSALPYLDAATTVFAFLTTWLVTQKVLQNWLFWIVINAGSFYMYVLNHYYAFSLLMIVYLFVAAFGYVNWLKHYKLAKAIGTQ